MDSRSAGFLIVIAGILLLVVGALVLAGGLSWFGRLPGDIRIERGSTSVYVPITTMLLVSLLLTLIGLFVNRFLS